MKFLDKKEQVLELQMTQYGKGLMSRGDFSPSYYAFFDDDVVYDNKYAARNQDGTDDVVKLESSTRISDRIANAIRPEVQYNYAGVESQINNTQHNITQYFMNKPSAGAMGEEYQLEQLTNPSNPIDSYYSQGLPMGTSEHGSSKAPAFDLNFHSGEITNLNLDGGVQFYTGSSGLLKIPQLDVEAVTEVSIHPGPPPEEIKENTDIKTWSDGSYVEIKNVSVLVDVGELNSLFEHENFDIEVYEVIEKHAFVGSAGLESGIGIKEYLRPLYFKKKMPVQDGLYDNSSEELEPETTDNVEYYFEVMVDEEISEEAALNEVISTNMSNMSEQDIYETPTNNNKGPC